MPEFYYSWIGKFQIHGSDGIARTCDGLQAHLSTHASIKVLDAVCRLPDVIRLEELPRSSIWPSLFMSAQVTEKNIGLYFFAKDVNSYNTYYRGLMNNSIKNDLALKGNLDGVELLIFPSNILPTEIRCWNHLLFFWGVFKERKANNSANSNTSILNARKSESRFNKKYRPLDINDYLEDEDDEVGVAETLVCDNKDGTTTEIAKHSSGAIGIEDTVMGPSTSHSVVPAKIEDLPDLEAAETLILLSKENILNA